MPMRSRCRMSQRITRVSAAGSISLCFTSGTSMPRASIIRRTEPSREPGKKSFACGCSRRATSAAAKASKSAPRWVAISSMEPIVPSRRRGLRLEVALPPPLAVADLVLDGEDQVLVELAQLEPGPVAGKVPGPGRERQRQPQLQVAMLGLAAPAVEARHRKPGPQLVPAQDLHRRQQVHRQDERHRQLDRPEPG